VIDPFVDEIRPFFGERYAAPAAVRASGASCADPDAALDHGFPDMPLGAAPPEASVAAGGDGGGVEVAVAVAVEFADEMWMRGERPLGGDLAAGAVRALGAGEASADRGLPDVPLLAAPPQPT
jgi:hypothetical protein